MLDYVKTVLKKVSISREMFEKELHKAFRFLSAEEIGQLRRWCYAPFRGKLLPVLDRVFSGALS
ncbi:hypothetical protein ACFSRY_18940 [Pontibacter locisalis]|uniref:Uncharacterized protein n=1 Tax=Pontibacter locisalis TaxID=1719035 RepID=A0ABW5IQU3_9BACT